MTSSPKGIEATVQILRDISVLLHVGWTMPYRADKNKKGTNYQTNVIATELDINRF